MADVTRQSPVRVSQAPSRPRVAGILIVTALVAWSLIASLFAVDVTEDCLVTRFGAVVRVVREPGLHVKAPFDSVVRLDKRLTYSRPGQAEFLTVDKKNIVVESMVTWRVADPERYYVKLATRSAADRRLGDVLLGEVGAVLGTHAAGSLIAPDADTERFRKIVGEIRGRVADFARTAYGIEVLDVALLQLSLPEQNRTPVFERMKAERGKMAKEYRTAGELQGKKIIAQADREKTHIEAEAYATAQRTRAEGDAEATRIYSAAFGRNPAFYKFLRTLQAYEKILDESTTLFLPADAEAMRLLRPLPRQGAAGPVQKFAAAAKSDQPVRIATPRRAGRPQAESTSFAGLAGEPDGRAQ
jgi:membrane protease subunit HflC